MVYIIAAQFYLVVSANITSIVLNLVLKTKRWHIQLDLNYLNRVGDMVGWIKASLPIICIFSWFQPVDPYSLNFLYKTIKFKPKPCVSDLSKYRPWKNFLWRAVRVSIGTFSKGNMFHRLQWSQKYYIVILYSQSSKDEIQAPN